MLRKCIWFLIDKVLFLESFLTREEAKKLLQTVMKISGSDRAAYYKQWRFCFLTYPKQSTVNAFRFKKSRKHWNFLLWFVGCRHSTNQRQKVGVPNLETSANLICISMNDVNMWEFDGCHIKIWDVYDDSVPQCVMWNHNKSVKYSSGPGLSRKQVQIISHYFQYSLTRSQKLTTCLTRGNIEAKINIVNPKSCQETLSESFVSWDTCISTFF